MNLTILSLNVRGLNDPDKIRRLKNYLDSQIPTFDVCLLQEHKLTGQKAADLGRSLNRQAHYFYTEALPGYSLADSGAGRGGTAILVHNRFNVANSGSIFRGRASWVVLSSIPGGDCGILNIYSPNNPAERKTLWELIPESVPQNCRWTVAGDLNMVESPVDKTTACGRILGDQEKGAWEALKLVLNIEDTFKPGRGLKFT